MELDIKAIIYSRLSSSRLPNKALLSLGQKAMIERVIESAKLLDVNDVIVATSSERSDDLLEEFIKLNCDCKVFRGDLNDVSRRTIQCLKKYDCDYFVRINGDSPILPIALINKEINFLRKSNESKIDLITNIATERTFPYGYSVEIIRSKTFIKYQKLFIKEEREHITKFFYNNLGLFNYKSLKCSNNYSSYGLAVDDEKSFLKVYKLLKTNKEIKNLELQKLVKILKKINND